jgi:glucosyl-dolichyl phosphate glucuronosyltransferase
MANLVGESSSEFHGLTSMTDISSAKLIVLLATHNGCNVLPDVLEGYAAVEAPERPWAIVVVDNASTDETSDILRSFQERLPLIVLHEPIPSKNRALNRALDHIGLSADLYIFTDDDAIPDPDYLRRWEEVLREHPDKELFGAVIRPYFRQPPPAWLDRFANCFGELYGKNERPLGEMPLEDIHGGNMAVRRSALARGHRFNEEIGPNSSQADYPMGSETEFCIRVGQEIPTGAWFADGPKVRHIVRPNQTTYEFLGRRAFRHGRGVAMRQAMADGRMPRLTIKGGLMHDCHRNSTHLKGDVPFDVEKREAGVAD